MSATHLSGPLVVDGYGGAEPTALLGGVGSSSDPATTSTADAKFFEYRLESSATSGDARGEYLRLYISGAGGGGEALRAFTTVNDVAAATAHGAHISLNFGTSGTVTGQGVAGRFTLHMPTTALTSNVTMSAVQAEIWSDGSTSDPGGSTKLSFFRAVNGGNANGMADVDDDAALFELIGFTAGSGNLVSGNTASKSTLDFTNWVTLRILIGSTVYYIPAAQTIGATT